MNQPHLLILVTCSSAAIHLAKCTDWSLIQVTSQTVLNRMLTSDSDLKSWEATFRFPQSEKKLIYVFLVLILLSISFDFLTASHIPKSRLWQFKWGCFQWPINRCELNSGEIPRPLHKCSVMSLLFITVFYNLIISQVGKSPDTM